MDLSSPIDFSIHIKIMVPEILKLAVSKPVIIFWMDGK